MGAGLAILAAWRDIKKIGSRKGAKKDRIIKKPDHEGHE